MDAFPQELDIEINGFRTGVLLATGSENGECYLQDFEEMLPFLVRDAVLEAGCDGQKAVHDCGYFLTVL